MGLKSLGELLISYSELQEKEKGLFLSIIGNKENLKPIEAIAINNNRIAKMSMTKKRIELLLLLKQKPMTMSEIAEKTNKNYASVGNLLSRLKKKHYPIKKFNENGKLYYSATIQQ